MSFRARLVHQVAIVTPVETGAVDADGQPVPGTATTVVVPGLIQPRAAREVPSVNQAGPEVSTHVGYMELRAVSQAAYLRFDPDDGQRFDVTGVRPYTFGRTPHLALDLREVKAP